LAQIDGMIADSIKFWRKAFHAMMPEIRWRYFADRAFCLSENL
jgi:hypothetical protein